MVSTPAPVFFDASVLVAASRSPTGGSAVAIEACQGTRFRAVLTTVILLEARWNIAEKFGEREVIRFYQQLAAVSPEVRPPPSNERLEWCVPLTGRKDAHVLAAALECGSTYMLILDRRHLLTPAVASADLPLKVMTPGDFLVEVVSPD